MRSNNLPKKSRENTSYVEKTNTAHFVQTHDEQSFFSSKNGFSKECTVLAQQLSNKAQILYQLKSSNKRFPMTERNLQNDIYELIKRLKNRGCEVKTLSEGKYLVSASEETKLQTQALGQKS